MPKAQNCRKQCGCQPVNGPSLPLSAGGLLFLLLLLCHFLEAKIQILGSPCSATGRIASFSWGRGSVQGRAPIGRAWSRARSLAQSRWPRMEHFQRPGLGLGVPSLIRGTRSPHWTEKSNQHRIILQERIPGCTAEKLERPFLLRPAARLHFSVPEPAGASLPPRASLAQNSTFHTGSAPPASGPG